MPLRVQRRILEVFEPIGDLAKRNYVEKKFARKRGIANPLGNAVSRRATMKARTLVGFLALFATTTVAHAQRACPAGAPCISKIGFNNSKALMIQVINASEFGALNVRWSRPGREGKQQEFDGGNGLIQVLSSTTPGVTYTVSVQGCNKRVVGRSSCSDWHQGMATAK